MKLIAIITLEAALMIGAVALAQNPPLATYKPNEVQSLKLQNLQLQAKLAQKEALEAQQRFAGALGELGKYADTVKGEQGWPKEVQFDQNSLSFSAPLPPPVTHPAEPIVKKDEPKKP